MIDFARSAADSTRRLYPHQIDTADIDTRRRVWLCGGCTARVAPRRSHTRAGGTRVLAHFATWPRADGEPTPHDDACAFLPARAARTPSAAHSATPREPNDPGATTWLLAAVEPATTPSNDAEPVPTDAPAQLSVSAPREHVAERPVQTTITGAHRILDLLRVFDDDPMQMVRFKVLWHPRAGQPGTELS